MISMPSESWLNLLCKHRYPDMILVQLTLILQYKIRALYASKYILVLLVLFIMKPHFLLCVVFVNISYFFYSMMPHCRLSNLFKLMCMLLQLRTLFQ